MNIRARQRGVTLIEVMIVVVIVSILLAIGLPGYQNQVRKTKRALGKGELQTVAARQEQYFINNKGYAVELDDLGYDVVGSGSSQSFYIDADSNVSASSSGAIYQIKFVVAAGPPASPSAGYFKLEADPVGGQAKDTYCGSLYLDSAGLKEADGPNDECW